MKSSSHGQQWLVPLGLGVGKLLSVGRKGLPTSANVSYCNNVVKPDNVATWTLRVHFVPLLPTIIL